MVFCGAGAAMRRHAAAAAGVATAEQIGSVCVNACSNKRLYVQGYNGNIAVFGK